MKFLLRVVLALVLLLGVFAGYLVIAPAAIDPVAWEPPAAPEMTGVLAPNELLRSATLIARGKIDGPEDVETDAQGRVYAGTNDGKVMRVAGDGVEVFADTGGRPLGLDFAPSGALIVADAVKGLLSISPEGQVTPLADGAGGVKFGFTDDVAVASDGVIYFSDASDKFGFGDHMLDLLEGRAHGRLLKYDPASTTTTTLADGLHFANGVALSRDESFVVVNETYRYRVARHWLTGPKAGTTETFVDGLPGFPDGIAQSGRGTFWVAMFTVRNPAGDFLAPRPLLKRMVANLPRALWPKPERYGLLLEIDEAGKILRSLHDPGGEVVTEVTSAHERDGALYIGHLHRDRITKLAL